MNNKELLERIKTLEDGIKMIIDQAELIPLYDNPKGTKQWMVNNQRTWIIKHAKDVLSESET